MTSVNGVSRRPAKANYKPLTWGNTMSEGDMTLTYMPAIVGELVLGAQR